jgi:glutathione S-transferase
MKLYYAPGACSLGIHVLMEEIGKPYEAIPVNLREGEQSKPPFTEINPKSKVPTLVKNDGSVLTEFPAIAYWLARTNPGQKLLPDGFDEQARVMEAMDYAVATIHMQGFTRLFRPTNFAPNAADEDTVKARGKEIVEKGFKLIDKTLEGKQFVAGQFSVADCALFYVETWAGRFGLPMPPNVQAHFERMKARPAVQAALKAEGLV